MKKQANPRSPKGSNPAFERFKDFTKRIVNVPKKDIDEYEKKRSKPPAKTAKNCN